MAINTHIITITKPTNNTAITTPPRAPPSVVVSDEDAPDMVCVLEGGESVGRLEVDKADGVATGGEVEGTATGDEVEGTVTGDEVEGTVTGDEVEGTVTGDEVEGAATGDEVEGTILGGATVEGTALAMGEDEIEGNEGHSPVFVTGSYSIRMRYAELS